MFTLEEIQEKWAEPAPINAAMGDSQSTRPNYNTVPDISSNAFLTRLQQRGWLHEEAEILDVGCGAGAYSMACAPLVKRSVGTDLSEKMIAAGRTMLEQHEISNVELRCENWHEVDLDERGWRNNFDLAFARNTPALSSSKALEKLLAASKSHYAMSSPTSMRDSLVDDLHDALGIQNSKPSHGSILLALNELLLRGYKPELEYEDAEWVNDQTVDVAVEFYSGRLGLDHKQREQREPAIRAFMEKRAVDGKVRSITTTTMVQIFWSRK